MALLLLYLLSDLFAYRTETTSDLFFSVFNDNTPGAPPFLLTLLSGELTKQQYLLI